MTGSSARRGAHGGPRSCPPRRSWHGRTRRGRRGDYVRTHCAPTLVQGRINPTFLPDRLTEYLQHVRDTTAFHRWYFGHYHIDREYDDGFIALYNCVVPIE